jgi:outer membrane protein OmpA-like peptidoglycan-associated protein
VTVSWRRRVAVPVTKTFLVSLVLLVVVVAAVGCSGQLFGKKGSISKTSISSPRRAAASALVVIEDEPLARGVIGTLVAATARTGERLVIATPADRLLESTTSPSAGLLAGPALPTLAGLADRSGYLGELIGWQRTAVAECYKGVALPGTPDLPSGLTSYQETTDQQAVTVFADKTASACRAALAASRAGLRAWAWAHSPEDPPIQEARLSEAVGSAVDMLGSLQQANGSFSRVIVVFCSNLAGTIPAGSLNGDVVIVVSDSQPSVDATTADQASLYGAGAASVNVLSPADPPGTLADLVAAGLATRTIPVSLAGVLFANNSSHLVPAATATLQKALGLLQTPGATAVIDGYSSSTGDPRQNMILSEARAQSVATWLETRRVAASALLVIGHGAHDFIAPGPSPANRRVTLVIDHPDSNP